MSGTQPADEKLVDADDLYEAALLLPQNDRASLAERLLESLHEDHSDGITEEMIQEVKRRLQAYREGKIETVPGEEVMKSLLASGEK